MIGKIQHSIFMQFLRHPFSTGAVCPSSCCLCKALTACVGLENAKTVAELGPGTGAVTRQILVSLPQDADFFSVELNKNLIPALVKEFPGVSFYNEDARNLRSIMDRRNISSLDAVISSLPWSIFPEELQLSLLDTIHDTLSDNGCFTTFLYVQGTFLPAGRRFLRHLGERFEVSRCRTVWRNMPPAYIYCCRKKSDKQTTN